MAQAFLSINLILELLPSVFAFCFCENVHNGVFLKVRLQFTLLLLLSILLNKNERKPERKQNIKRRKKTFLSVFHQSGCDLGSLSFNALMKRVLISNYVYKIKTLAGEYIQC